jgi:hypothetical protein
MGQTGLSTERCAGEAAKAYGSVGCLLRAEGCDQRGANTQAEVPLSGSACPPPRTVRCQPRSCQPETVDARRERQRLGIIRPSI